MLKRSIGAGEGLFEPIPEEILLHIFSFLDRSALIHCRRACQRWKKLAEDPWMAAKIGGRTPNSLHLVTIGPSGSGKSTLNGRILAALRPEYASLLHRYEREIPIQEAANESRHKTKVVQLEGKQMAERYVEQAPHQPLQVVARSVENHKRKMRRLLKSVPRKNMNPYMWLVDKRLAEREAGRTVAMSHTTVRLSFVTSLTIWNVSGKRSNLNQFYRVATMSDVGLLVIPGDMNKYKKLRHDIYRQGDQENEKEKEQKEEKPQQTEVKKKELKAKKFYLSSGGAPQMGLLNEQVMLAKAAGVKRLAIVINEMCSDVGVAQNSAAEDSSFEKTFKEIRDDLIASELLKNAGFVPEPIVIPCSTLNNVNISSPGYDWFKGPTVMEALSRMASNIKNYRYPYTVTPASKTTPTTKKEEFTMPIHEVYKLAGVGLVVCGRITSGTIELKDKATIVGEPSCKYRDIQVPSGRNSIETLCSCYYSKNEFEVSGIEVNYAQYRKAKKGDFVGINLDQAKHEVVEPGYVLKTFVPKENSKLVPRFKVFVKLLCATGNEMHEGADLVALIHTMRLSCKVRRVRLSDKDKKVVAKIPLPSRSTATATQIIPTIKPRSYLILKLRTDDPKGSKGTHVAEGDRVVLRDNNSTLAAGIVMKAYDTNARLRKEVERMKKEMAEEERKLHEEQAALARLQKAKPKPKPKSKPTPRKK